MTISKALTGISTPRIPVSRTEEENNFHREKSGHVIKLDELLEHVEKSMASGGFDAEFHTIPDGQLKPWAAGEKKENVPKHRYESLRAYDETRVVLEGDHLPEDSGSDYINANWIDGYGERKSFIATQGPLEGTVSDFWRMVWQERVSVIVMLVNVLEQGKVKCEKYWPDDCRTYKRIRVTLKEEHDLLPGITYRTFLMEKDGTIRQINQIHFTEWPDMGVPQNPLSLVTLLQKVESFSQKSSGPVLVHCSAGVGRTGTLILLHNALQMARKEGKVDVHALLSRFREQRVSMVETVPQYSLVFRTLAEVFTGQFIK